MKKLILFTLLLLTNFVNSQNLIQYDYVENWSTSWSGIWWTPISTTGYPNNASVTPTSSAALWGSGGGTSGYESDWYSFPNLVVNSTSSHIFKFRLGSYRFTSTGLTRGVDVGDYITVQLSTDGGTTYQNELRITGNNNAYWDYNSTAYDKVANGTLTTIGPGAGGDRTSTGDGYSTITLTIPAGVSNIAIDIFARANANGEEWWMDNFELFEIPEIPLPVELISFSGVWSKDERKVNLSWETLSEYNSSHYMILSSLDGVNWSNIININAAGNSNQKLKYTTSDFNPSVGYVNYYKLVQYDLDGKWEEFDIIAVNIPKVSDNCNPTYYDIDGKIVDFSKASPGIYIKECDGQRTKIYKSN